MVIVVVSKRFCMMRWLPRWRTAANPFYSRIRQISEPERTRSLPNRHLNLSHENFAVKALGDFGWGGRDRTAANPFYSRIRQISEPERTRSLPNRHLNLSHENFAVKALGDFGWGG